MEDIIDTGRTMTKALKLLAGYSPASVQCARLDLPILEMQLGSGVSPMFMFKPHSTTLTTQK